MATQAHHAPAGAAPAGPAPRVRDLSGIARDALAISPPLYVQSILGPLRAWVPPYRRFSELSLLNPWRPLRTLKVLQNTWLPSLPMTPPTFNPPGEAEVAPASPRPFSNRAPRPPVPILR